MTWFRALLLLPIILGCRIAAIARDCKSLAFGLRWFESNHPNKIYGVLSSVGQNARMWIWRSPVRFRQFTLNAPVAQWIRASAYEAEGRKFESCLVYQHMRDGAVVASESHNLRVGGSNLPPATNYKPGCPSGSRGRSAKPVFFAQQSAKGDDVGS